MTREVVRLIGRLDETPALLISGSAVGWYGLWQDEALTEFDGGKACFSHRLCDAWERMAMRAQTHGTRVVRLRIGLVLGTEGGMLSRMLTPFEVGLGGPLGNGPQWMSWIERDDLVRLIAHIMVTPRLNGAVNATAPVPVRNAEFTRELGRAFRRPAFMPMPAFALRLLGDLADELLLGGQQVLPDKALESGFQFRHETLRSALGAMLPRPDASEASQVFAQLSGGHAGDEGLVCGAFRPHHRRTFLDRSIPDRRAEPARRPSARRRRRDVVCDQQRAEQDRAGRRRGRADHIGVPRRGRCRPGGGVAEDRHAAGAAHAARAMDQPRASASFSRAWCTACSPPSPASRCRSPFSATSSIR